MDYMFLDTHGYSECVESFLDYHRLIHLGLRHIVAVWVSFFGGTDHIFQVKPVNLIPLTPGVIAHRTLSESTILASGSLQELSVPVDDMSWRT
jgi:hypothetical protein